MENFLNAINFIQLNTWDINRIFQNDGLEGMVPLSSFLKHYQKIVSKEEAIDKHLYIVSKISFGGTLYLNDFDKIYTVKGSLYEIPKNAITYSKINVRHGCCYWNTTSNSVLASSEYPTFLVDENKVLPEYLIMILRHPRTLKQFNSKLRGFTKARVSVTEFLLTKIPLPSIERQKELVAQYNALLNLAKDKENQAEQMEQSIDDYLIAELGIKDNLTLANKNLFKTVEYKNLDQWGKIVNSQNFITFFDVIPFADIVTEGPFYGANIKGSNINNGCRYIRITDIKDDGSLNNDIVYPEVVDNRYLLQENDFLIARSGATVGKTFLYKTSYGKCIFAGYLVRYRINSNVNPMYLLYYTQASPYKKWVKITQRVAAQPNINGQEYLKFPFVFPPLDIQNQIVEEITLRKEQIKNLRDESEKLRLQALSNFEKEVFN